ncbi:hypothetical protein V6N12_035059 [Hibiscus sabdariffa]|uniref:Uncharacterized protein n=1 Tax=Hibiscus sabdariffa TaxID=183260 RepID=A0ABR2AF87_9ROSI
MLNYEKYGVQSITTQMVHKQQANRSPYDNNEGSCVVVVDDDYCVSAAETQMLTDVKAMQKHLAARHMIYQH